MCCIMLTGAIIASLLAAYSALYEYWESTNKFMAIFGTSSLPVILYYALKAYMWLRKIPPGPWGIPGLGSLWEMNWGNSLQKCHEYAKKFGKIFQMRVGLFRVTVLSDYKQILEASRKQEFQGRPDFELWNFRNRGRKDRGILLSDAVRSWEEQRRLVSNTVQQGSIGKETFEDVTLNQVKNLIKSLKQSQSTALSLKDPVNRSVFNALWAILCGNRVEPDEARYKEITSLIGGRWDKALLFNAGFFFPWLKKLDFLGLLGGQALDMIDNVTDTLDEVIRVHLDEPGHGVPRDYIDIYLEKHFQPESSGSSFAGREGIQNLRVTLLDLLQSGTEKTASTILWALAYIARSPSMQRKLQEEIHMAIGIQRLPTRSDRALMPYLEAFTNEVHRKSSVAPFGVLHQVTQDCQFAGYRFEKGTIVIPNIYSAHHDTSVWGDPEKFRPERFLDSSGKKVVLKEAFIPFASGKRSCVGQGLAQDMIFLFLTTLLQNFSFELDPGTPDLDVHTPIPYFVSSPGEFKVILTPRPTRY